METTVAAEICNGSRTGWAATRLPPQKLAWKTFYPLVDTKLFRPQSRPRLPKFTTVGQWYWGGAVEVAGEFPDLSKRFAFERYLNLPARVPEAQFELAMNIAAEIPKESDYASSAGKLSILTGLPGRRSRIAATWPARLPNLQRSRALSGWRTGWISDRAAAFLALGRPVITEETGQSVIFRQKMDSVLSGPAPRRRRCCASAARMVAPVEASAAVRGRSLRFDQKSSAAYSIFKALDLPLQNDFRVILVVPLWLT